MPPGSKVICIANDGQALAKAKIPIEGVKPLTPEAMTKILYMEADWEAVAAQRVSRLAQGDWRQVANLKRLFDGAGIDLSGRSEEDFQAALKQMSRDRHTECHPSLRAHQMFSGNVRDLESYARPDVLAWGECNLGLTCKNSLESMANMQEAAATADVLCTGGQYELGLDHFVRSAAALYQTGVPYEYATWSNPWAAPTEKTTKPTRRERGSCSTVRRQASRC